MKKVVNYMVKKKVVFVLGLISFGVFLCEKLRGGLSKVGNLGVDSLEKVVIIYLIKIDLTFVSDLPVQITGFESLFPSLEVTKNQIYPLMNVF